MHLLRHRKIPREHDAYLEEMKMKFAKRMDRFGEGIFSRLAEIKNKRISEGKEVIDLSIGAPNIPPAEHIRKALCEEAMKPENYVYAISDTKKLLDTVADWYKRRYDVELDPDTEICSLLGSQEGLAHIALSIADEGDIVMVPDPCYPVFGDGPQIAGAELYYMPLKKENDYIIQLQDIPEEVARKADPNDHTYIVPAFSGLGAPWWRDDIYASISGMSRTTGREEIVKAGCECIAYQINDVIDAMRKDSEIDISQMCVDGGPTRNKYLMQFQSDISQTEIKIPDAEELSVIGAGYLAGESAGYYEPDDIYKAITYNFFETEMPEQERNEKVQGWNEAVEMLLKK